MAIGGVFELVISVTVGVIAFFVGRHYTYNHPMAKKMQEKRERNQQADPPDTSTTE